MLFDKHNEHPYLMSNIFNATLYELISKASVYSALLFANLTLFTSYFFVIRRISDSLISLCLAFLILNPIASENHVFASAGIGIGPAILFAFLSFLRIEKQKNIISTLCLSLISAFSFANGIFSLLTLSILSLSKKNFKQAFIYLLAFTSVLLALSNGTNHLLEFNLKKLIYFFLSLNGSAFGFDSALYSRVIGAALLLVAIFILFNLVKNKKTDEFQFEICSLIFLLFTNAAISIGRYHLDFTSSFLISRYKIFSIFILAFVIIILFRFYRLQRKFGLSLAISGFVFYICSYSYYPELSFRSKLLGDRAILYSLNHQFLLHPYPPSAISTLNELDKLNIFKLEKGNLNSYFSKQVEININNRNSSVVSHKEAIVKYDNKLFITGWAFEKSSDQRQRLHVLEFLNDDQSYFFELQNRDRMDVYSKFYRKPYASQAIKSGFVGLIEFPKGKFKLVLHLLDGTTNSSKILGDFEGN